MDSKDLTFVVQGPIYTASFSRFGLTTKEVLKSIRVHFPDSPIVLSTWEGSSMEGLDYDYLILNQDPGSVKMAHNSLQKIPSNLNRLLITSKSGLQNVQTRYACKTRTDILFTGSQLLHLKNSYERQKDAVMKERIIISPFYTRNAYLYKVFCLHFSDTFLLGLTQDLQQVFSVSLASEKTLFPMFNETYIWSHVFGISWENSTHFTLIKYSEKLLANEFIVYKEKQLGIKSPFLHPFHVKLMDWMTCYQPFMWKWTYRIYVEKKWWWIPIKNLTYWLMRTQKMIYIVGGFFVRLINFLSSWNNIKKKVKRKKHDFS